jgi:hypothetical protein
MNRVMDRSILNRQDSRQLMVDREQKTEITVDRNKTEMKMFRNEADVHRVESSCCHQMETCSLTEAEGKRP